MKKISIRIYDETDGNRWHNFVTRNRQIFGKENFGDTLQKKLRMFFGIHETFRVSYDRILQLTKEPQLRSSQKKLTLERQQKIFILGCCFSRYIRSILEQMMFDVYPKFLTLEFDPRQIVVATLPKKYSLAWYSTFTIRQEFDRLAGTFAQSSDDVWTLAGNEMLWDRHPQFKGKTIYADPYRRNIFSPDKGVLHHTIKEIDRLVKEGIEKSDVVILTLGLTDVFKKRDSGRICCAMPNFFDFEKQCEIVTSDYEQNYDNLKSIMRTMEVLYPQKKVIFMVAPVSIAATFTGDDIYLASEESKAILRAAAIKIGREFKNAYYFPAFEIFQLISLSAKKRYLLYNQAMRNLSMVSVEKIMAHFFRTYYDLSTWGKSRVKVRFSDAGE